MIPDNKVLKKRCKRHKIRVKPDTYFQNAEEYIHLQTIFETESIFDLASLFLDMFLYPIYVIYQISILEPSPMFVFGLMKTYELWKDWFRYTELKFQISLWTLTVKKLGGPWISTNDPTYHIYVYADAMQRLSLFNS
jgi:hypothetical protein